MKKNTKKIMYIIIILGILLRIIYICKTTYGVGNDIGTIGSKGHLDYIYTIFKTGNLPLTNEVQFYQPPLWHILAAIFLKIVTLLGVSLNTAFESLQVLTVIISSINLIIVKKITDYLKIDDKGKLLIIAFMSFLPSLIYLSGNINNDCLCVCLEFLIFLYLLKWNENPTWKNTLILAISTGLCVMTKASGAVMSIPILYVFIKKLIENKKSLKNIIIKILVFCLISLPIGLWYQVRNIYLFDSISILEPENSGLYYIGDYSYIDRFIKININNTFECSFGFDCHNIFDYIAKTSIFPEVVGSDGNLIQSNLLICNIILILISFIFIIKRIIKWKDNTFIDKLLLITYITNIISYIVFNILYPYYCSMNFRYILFTGYIGIVILLEELNNINIKKIKSIILAILYYFLLLCVLVLFITLIFL